MLDVKERRGGSHLVGIRHFVQTLDEECDCHS